MIACMYLEPYCHIVFYVFNLSMSLSLSVFGAKANASAVKNSCKNDALGNTLVVPLIQLKHLSLNNHC